MKRLLFLLVFAVVGAGIGAGAGLFLKPEKEELPRLIDAEDVDAEKPEKQAKAKEKSDKKPADKADPGGADHEFVKLNNQFVVPVVEQGKVRSLVILSLSLDVEPGTRERIYEMEPRIRDTLLSVLFDHANSGGFSGSFTDAHAMAGLRGSMRQAVVSIMGGDVKDVLVLDIVRQDVS